MTKWSRENGTVRHCKDPDGTIRNRTKIRKLQQRKIKNKIARKKLYQTVRGNSRHFIQMFHFSLVFAGSNAAKHALNSDVSMRAKIDCSNYTFSVP